MTNEALSIRLKYALEQDNSIAVTLEEAAKHPGFPLEYLTNLGLRKADLKKLISGGLAIRGYTRTFYNEGDVLPGGRVVPKGMHFRGKGHQARYILLKELPVNGQV